MRVEPAPRVYRNEDRRQRSAERRTCAHDRRAELASRARHEPHHWFQPAFGAHILGQISPETVNPAHIQRAYAQPEAKTPLRPSFTEAA
jgi:hypothetical protein